MRTTTRANPTVILSASTTFAPDHNWFVDQMLYVWRSIFGGHSRPELQRVTASVRADHGRYVSPMRVVGPRILSPARRLMNPIMGLPGYETKRGDQIDRETRHDDVASHE